MAERSRIRPALGTFVEISCDASNPLEAASAAFAVIDQVQETLSFHQTDSDLSRLNGANGEAIAVTPMTRRVLILAKNIMRKSNGLFNPLVGGQLVLEGRLPDHGISTLIAKGQYDDLYIGPKTASLKKGVLITLDGIAKGYAVDLAIRALKASGAISGMVNAGGDSRAFGPRAYPFQQRLIDGTKKPLISLENQALATSAQSPTSDPAFPARLIAPQTADDQPVGIWSITAPTCWRADALTKVAAASTARGDTVTETATLIKLLGGEYLPSPQNLIKRAS